MFAPAPSSAIVALFLFAAPSVLHAQEDLRPHAVVLGLGGDGVAERAREARAIAGAALEADGVRLVPEANVALRIAPARLAGCAAIDCALDVGRELGVAMVAAVTLWRGPPESVTVSLILDETRSYTASREIGAAGLEDAVRAAVREAQSARGRALSPADAAATATPAATAPPSQGSPSGQAPAGRSLEEWVLPITLGAVGLGMVALSAYALVDEICSLRGASGTCLRGDRANIGLGATLAVLGGLAVAGSIVWLVVGGLPTMSAGRGIDVILLPNGLIGRF